MEDTKKTSPALDEAMDHLHTARKEIKQAAELLKPFLGKLDADFVYANLDVLERNTSQIIKSLKSKGWIISEVSKND